jgi:hypothetical protein
MEAVTKERIVNFSLPLRGRNFDPLQLDNLGSWDRVLSPIPIRGSQLVSSLKPLVSIGCILICDLDGVALKSLLSKGHIDQVPHDFGRCCHSYLKQRNVGPMPGWEVSSGMRTITPIGFIARIIPWRMRKTVNSSNSKPRQNVGLVLAHHDDWMSCF